MKSTILILFLSLMLAISQPSSCRAATMQQESEQVESNAKERTFFGKIFRSVKDSASEFVVVFVFGLFAKNGWTLALKRIAGVTGTVTQEIGETFLAGSHFFRTLDESIEADGKLKQNSMAELLRDGREVIAEAKDVIISIKPKPNAIKT